MKRPIILAASALSLALFAAASFVFLRAYRGGITIHLGDSREPALPPPPAPQTGAAQIPNYTNEELHALLQEEASNIGIQSIVARGERAPEPAAEGFLGSRLGRPGTRARAEAAIRQLAGLRRAWDAGKKPVVPLRGETVSLLAASKTDGGPLESQASRADTASSPQTPVVEQTAPDSWSGLYGGTFAGTLTVSDDANWTRLWAGITGRPRPGIDFSRRQVVGVFLGTRPSGGFRVEIDPAATVLPAAILVRWREITPSPGHSPPEGATAPFALRAMARSELPVRFERLP